MAKTPVAYPLLLSLALSACGSADNQPGPGEVTVGEARALDEAAAMLDSRQLGKQQGDQKDGQKTKPAEADTAPAGQ